MSRATRVAVGWGMALTAALLLSFAAAGPMAAPEPARLAGATSPTPQPTAAQRPASTLVDDTLPPFRGWPLPHAGGWGRPAQLVAVPEAEAAALQAAVDRAREEFGLYALTVGVAARERHGWAGASGLARDGVTPLDADSPFAIASITKTFTASLVLQLVDEGRLSLGDEVAPLLPELGLPAGVTVRQLLSHTSGLADLLAPMREAMNAEPDRRWTAAEVISLVTGRWFAPGLDYGYSNTNYVLLGLLVERLTGSSFADELSRRLLRPLNLAHSGVLLSDGAPMLMTPSWASTFGTSGSMYSSASDLVRWGEALYRGHVVSDEMLAQMTSFNSDDYGLGTERIELDGHVGYGHSGLLRGFTSLLVHLPAEGVTVAIVGSWQGYDPEAALTFSEEGHPSILELALATASR